MSRGPWVSALLVCGCLHTTGPRSIDDLTGLTLALKPSPALRLCVLGSVGSVPADIIFDVAGPLTRVSKSCFSQAPLTGNTVKVPRPDGETDTMPEVKLSGVSFGGIHYAPLTAGLVSDDTCVVVLGNDVLSPYALRTSVATRELFISRTQLRTHYAEMMLKPPPELADDEMTLLEVTREPRGDWPMLAVRVKQAGAELTGPFLLSSGDDRSALSQSAAHASGFRTGEEVYAGLHLPEAVALPPELEGFRGVQYDALELAPGVGVGPGSLKMIEGPEGRPVLGVIGSDVWGRWDAVLDVRAGVLLLSRPRVSAAGTQQRCERGGKSSEEACYQLNVTRDPSLAATATVWRTLPEGGRLHLDFVGPGGQPISTVCRLGFTFSPGGRGESTQHQLPWNRLEQVMPACAEAIKQSTSVELSLFEDGALAECPGTCAFAQDLRTNRVTCECQPHSNGATSDAERRFLKLYQDMIERQRGAMPREREPDDPEK